MILEGGKAYCKEEPHRKSEISIRGGGFGF